MDLGHLVGLKLLQPSRQSPQDGYTQLLTNIIWSLKLQSTPFQMSRNNTKLMLLFPTHLVLVGITQ
nr:hypothetical protein Iba_chr06fCG7020 [Ipomoea batatas]GME09458.1 hypothetical protein Iba_scaffold8757CG0010 [Ipomoea batatas]